MSFHERSPVGRCTLVSIIHLWKGSTHYEDTFIHSRAFFFRGFYIYSSGGGKELILDDVERLASPRVSFHWLLPCSRYTCLKTECLENVTQSFWHEIWFRKHSLRALNKSVQIRPGWTFDTALDDANGVSLHKGVENLSADLQTTQSIFFSSPAVGVWRRWEGFWTICMSWCSLVIAQPWLTMPCVTQYCALFWIWDMGYGMGRLIPTRFHPARMFAVKDQLALKSRFRRCNML